MKEGLSTGQTWNSAEYSGQYSGQNVKLHYVFTCANANATVTVNGQSFSNVYVINFKGQVSLLGSGTLAWQTIQQLDLSTFPEFGGTLNSKSGVAGTPENARSRLVREFERRLQVNNRKLIEGFYGGLGAADIAAVMRVIAAATSQGMKVPPLALTVSPTK